LIALTTGMVVLKGIEMLVVHLRERHRPDAESAPEEQLTGGDDEALLYTDML
jgi:hypothetical protein